MPGSTRSFEFAKRLVLCGYSVHMVTSNWQNKSINKFSIIDGINVHWGSMKYSNNMNFLKRIMSFLAFIFYVIKVGYKLDYDLLLHQALRLQLVYLHCF